MAGVNTQLHTPKSSAFIPSLYPQLDSTGEHEESLHCRLTSFGTKWQSINSQNYERAFHKNRFKWKPPATPLALLPVSMWATHSGSRKDGILSGFHYYLMDWCPRALGGLILMELFADARHCGLRAVLWIRGVWPIICVAGWQCKPHDAGGWLRRRRGQSVPSISWRNLIMTMRSVRSS